MKSVVEIKAKISALKEQIKTIQGKCRHDPKHIELEPFTYSVEVDDPWNYGNTYPVRATRFHCNQCDRRWREDGTTTLSKYTKRFKNLTQKPTPKGAAASGKKKTTQKALINKRAS